MSIRLAYILPVIYAVLGGLLWGAYGVKGWELMLWIGVQAVLLVLYIWLIRGGTTGLMMKFHLVVTGVGMVLLFYVLFPWRTDQSANRILIELLVMIGGTFLCSTGVFSLLYLIGRKVIADSKLSSTAVKE